MNLKLEVDDRTFDLELPDLATQNLDAITAKHTAFATFSDLVNAAGNYRPSIYLGGKGRAAKIELVVLTISYNQTQKAKEDDRRAYKGDWRPLAPQEWPVLDETIGPCGVPGCEFQAVKRVMFAVGDQPEKMLPLCQAHVEFAEDDLPPCILCPEKDDAAGDDLPPSSPPSRLLGTETCWQCCGKGDNHGSLCMECRGTGRNESLGTYWQRNGIVPVLPADRRACPRCRGTGRNTVGSNHAHECKMCKGIGSFPKTEIVFKPCPICRGTGNRQGVAEGVNPLDCLNCNGSGFVVEQSKDELPTAQTVGPMGSGEMHYCPKCRAGVFSCIHDVAPATAEAITEVGNKWVQGD